MFTVGAPPHRFTMVNPLLFSQQLLALFGTRLFTYNPDRVPRDGAVLVVSNHRSFMDALVLMQGLNRPIRFACHHYMSRVPLMRDMVSRLGCFPLDAPHQRQQTFFQQATEFLYHRQVVGIFPEGTTPMVQPTEPGVVGEFHRGFAHLALRSPVADLAVLPVAIASHQETDRGMVPVRLLSWFDPTEPLFQQPGLHPMVVYQRVDVMVGRPIWISRSQRHDYQGKRARSVVADLTHHCHHEIQTLLHSK